MEKVIITIVLVAIGIVFALRLRAKDKKSRGKFSGTYGGGVDKDYTEHDQH